MCYAVTMRIGENRKGFICFRSDDYLVLLQI